MNSKLPNVSESIFAVMSKMAKDYNAINLSQGFPDFNCSEKLLSLVQKFQDEGYNQYAPMPGVPQLREEIAKKYKTIYGGNFNADTEITVTAGGTQALYTAITAFIHAGDECIIFEPAYDSYVPGIILSGGKAIPVPFRGNDFHIDWNEVRSKITPKTKMILINTPQNPTGKTFTEQDFNELTEIVLKNNLILLSDEVYEHIIFDGRKHFSITGKEELKKNSLTVFSFGKTYHTTGWKMGYVLAEKSLTKEFRKVHQFNVFSVNTPYQYAYAEMMKDYDYYPTLNDFFKQKRDLLLASLKNSRFTFQPAEGTYFQLLDYSNISEMSDMQFSEWLTKEIGVAVIPLSPFFTEKYDGKFIRLCFAKSEAVLKHAAEKLSAV